MSKSNKHSTLHTIKNDFLTCAICLENLENPKSLQCLHKFCESCLDAYVTSKGVAAGSEFECPLRCKELTKLPPNRVQGLKTDFTIKALVDFLDEKEEFYATYSSAALSNLNVTTAERPAQVNNNAENVNPTLNYQPETHHSLHVEPPLNTSPNGCSQSQFNQYDVDTCNNGVPPLPPRRKPMHSMRPKVPPPPVPLLLPVEEVADSGSEVEAMLPDHGDLMRHAGVDMSYDDIMQLVKKISLIDKCTDIKPEGLTEEEMFRLAMQESLSPNLHGTTKTRADIELNDIIKSEDIRVLSIVQLQHILNSNNRNHLQCSTKSQLVTMVKELWVDNVLQRRPLPCPPQRGDSPPPYPPPRPPTLSTRSCPASPSSTCGSPPPLPSPRSTSLRPPLLPRPPSRPSKTGRKITKDSKTGRDQNNNGARPGTKLKSAKSLPLPAIPD